MTQPAANCPNCGAKILFRWSSSVQTVCEYCKSILVRTDVDLKKVGQVADLPPNSSPIQIGTEGVYNHHPFVAVGRIIYEYDQGAWNEWHLVMNNSSAWLSFRTGAVAEGRPAIKPRRSALTGGVLVCCANATVAATKRAISATFIRFIAPLLLTSNTTTPERQPTAHRMRQG